MKLSVDIEKRVGDFALRVQFETEGVLGLLGASGSGKSMTLRCIAGLLTPDRGRIALGERVLFDSAAGVNLPPQQRRVGYLFQQYALFPHMTVRQNIRCACRKRDRRAREAFIDDLLQRFDLVGLGERYPAQLSGGEQQRSALARIFAAEPKLLLLDEPTAALDQFLKWNVEREIGELLAQFAGPALWVTHDWAECRRSCDRICVMEAGRASAVTTAQELLRAPSSVAAARIAGCRNFTAAQITADALYLPEWEIVLPCCPPEGCTVLAIPDGAIDFAGELLSCRVHRLLDDAAGTVAVLQPLRGKAPLYVTLPPSVRISAGEMLTIGFFAEKLLYY